MGLQSETPADGRDRGRERDNDRDRARDRDRDRESTDRVVKKRASQACHNCRTRKVKCDLVAAGIPCSNCKADNVECIVIESRRSRKYRLQKRRLNGLVSLPPLSQAPPKLTTESSLASGSVSSDATNNAESIPGVVVPSQTSPATSTGPPTSIIHLQSPPAVTTPAASLSAPSHKAPRGSICSNLPSQTPPVTFPSYIRPPRAGFPPDDVEYLTRRGALNLPQPDLRDELLRCFVLFVYPYMPTIDLEDFLGAIDGREGCSKISLAVFQAVMFAGTSYVDLELLQQAGYATRRAARSDFYQKVKLLYDFDWDVDRIALIQAILLMNYWYISEHDQKDPWHWLGICISLATSIGMNQADTYSKKDPQTCRLWKRIWWACVIRDRISAMSMRRPMRITDENISLPLLTPDDFDSKPITTLVPSLQQCRILTESSSRRKLAEMCVSKAQLLLTIGHILKKCYILRSFGGSTSEVTMLYTPRRAETINDNDVATLHDELNQWYRNRPISCRLCANIGISTGTTTSNADDDVLTDNVLFLHRSVLKMLFLVATEALNRPQTLSVSKSRSASGPGAGAGPRSRSSSISKVKEAADKMSEIVQCLNDRDLVRYLPPLSVSFMLLAIAAFLVEIKTHGPDPVDLHTPGQQWQWQLHRCVRALLSLRDIWPIADSACVLVGQMLNRSQVGATLGLALPGIQPKQPTVGANEVLVDKNTPSNRSPSAATAAVQPAVELLPTTHPQHHQQQQQSYKYDHHVDSATNNAFLTSPAVELKATPGPSFTPNGIPSSSSLVVAQARPRLESPVITTHLPAQYNTWPGPGLEEPVLDFDFDFDSAGIANEQGHIGHGHISNGHALHMDYALAECYSLGDFENSILDFDFDSAGYGFSG